MAAAWMKGRHNLAHEMLQNAGKNCFGILRHGRVCGDVLVCIYLDMQRSFSPVMLGRRRLTLAKGVAIARPE
jgi:hypothetical protein